MVVHLSTTGMAQQSKIKLLVFFFFLQHIMEMNVLFLWQGYHSRGWNNQLVVYDTVTNRWTNPHCKVGLKIWQ